jgi:PAS domain S-box-containing protein
MSASDQPAVLLVDDRPENLLALEAVLHGLDCRLVTAGSGREALKVLLGGDDFAVILLDVQMPDLDGFETAEYIKQRERTAAIPIIFVTAISKDQDNVFRGYESGAVDYLFKPFEPTVLRSKVSIFLELHRATRQLRDSSESLQATFDRAPIGMARLDHEGLVLDANRALAQTLDIDAPDLRGRTLDDLTHPDDRGLDAAQRRELLEGAVDRYDVQKRLIGANGAGIPVLMSISLARAPGDGQAGLLVLQVQDLRERRRAERERHKLIREQAARAEAEAAQQRLEAVQQITDATLAHVALDELLPELLDRIADVLHVDSVAVVLGENDASGEVVVHAAGGAGAQAVKSRRPSTKQGLAERVDRMGDALIIEDVSRSTDVEVHLLGEAIVSVLAVPLIVEGRPLGALEVGTILPREFTDHDARLLRLAADRAALVIERTRLHEQEHLIASELQASLLPDLLPDVPGLDMAARYLPGGAGARVGGDWYDAIALPGARLAIVMGDVAGHGIAAASIMGQLRSATRAYVLDGAAPGEALERLNRFLLTVDADTMATVAICLVEPATGTVCYANAGHCLPFLRTQKGKPAFLAGGGGVPLGALDAPVYEEASTTLGGGDTLVLYTDGLIEERGTAYDEGLRRLEESTTKSGADLERLCDRILRGTVGDGIRDDDVTLLVLRVLERLEDHVHLEVIGAPDALSSSRALLRRWLRETTQDGGVVADVTMAVNEAVQNAIEHAHGLARTKIDVELDRRDGEIMVAVRDRGRWLSEGRDSAERGRGLDLMRALMDEVEIDQRPSGSVVVLRHRLRATPFRRTRRAPAA